MTSYGGLFNANTFFDEPNFILLDDAHAAENYLAGFWTVAVGREEHQALYEALALPGQKRPDFVAIPMGYEILLYSILRPQPPDFAAEFSLLPR